MLNRLSLLICLHNMLKVQPLSCCRQRVLSNTTWMPSAVKRGFNENGLPSITDHDWYVKENLHATQLINKSLFQNLILKMTTCLFLIKKILVPIIARTVNYRFNCACGTGVLSSGRKGSAIVGKRRILRRKEGTKHEQLCRMDCKEGSEDLGLVLSRGGPLVRPACRHCTWAWAGSPLPAYWKWAKLDRITEIGSKERKPHMLGVEIGNTFERLWKVLGVFPLGSHMGVGQCCVTPLSPCDIGVYTVRPLPE